MAEPLFPAGLAEGSAFLNRKIEIKDLTKNIENLVHTVLVAPRRYGKTSLINKVAKGSGHQYAWIELLSATSFEDVQKKIETAVGSLVLELYSDVKKLQEILKKYFKTMTADIVLSAAGQKVIFHTTASHEKSITDILLNLDAVAQAANKKVIIVFDEFQQLAEIKESQSLEACIRHAVERSKNIVYLFSGSNRHMLNEMFGSHSRPLYRLCEAMKIDRMSAEVYAASIQQAAKLKWKKELNDDAFLRMMQFSERHPYYVNVLCSTVWRNSEKIPTADIVEDIWSHYILTHKNILLGDYFQLSLNQKKLLTALAKQPTAEPYGRDFLQFCGLSTSSLDQAMNSLVKKDLVMCDEQGFYRNLDPGIGYYLSHF